MLRLRRFLLVFLVAAAFCTQAVAAPSSPATGKDAAAKAHYQKGALLYRQADYARAWLEFTSAYQLLPKDELLFNMARCEVKLGRHADALQHFQAYLEAIPNDPDADGIRKEMAALRIEVNQSKKREVERDPAPVLLAKEEPQRSRRPFPVYGTIAGGGTLLLGIVSVALLGSVNSKYAQLRDSCSPVCSSDEVRPLEQQATAGYVFLGITAAAAVTTAALLTWELRRGTEPKRSARWPSSAGSSLSLGWRY